MCDKSRILKEERTANVIGLVPLNLFHGLLAEILSTIKAIKRLANWQGVKQWVFGKLVEGKIYKVSGWVRLDNAKSDTISLSFNSKDSIAAQKLLLVLTTQATETDSNWTSISRYKVFI